MDEALSRKCDAHLKSLLKRSQAIHFAKPVDWKKMGLHDSPRLIKQPMDLGTVGRKLECGAYLSADGFARDVGLVLQNAIVFNSWRYAAAQFWRSSAQFAHGPSITSTARTSASTPR